MIKKLTKEIEIIFFIIIFSSIALLAQESKYPLISASKAIIVGDSGKWDFNKTHTLSVVHANKDGYKYWGYYGLSYYGGDPSLRKAGLAFSNDLIHWDKYEGNPIIKGDCRWPTVLLHNSVFYMFYAEYDSNNDSRIVMVTSKDGKHFSNKTVVIKREIGTQNQNPFIYFNKMHKNYYLFYYHGVERSNDKPLVGRQGINKKSEYIKQVKNFWQIRFVKNKLLTGLKNAKPVTLMTSSYTIASPSIAFYNNKYYLLVESIKEGSWDNKWVTLAYESSKIDGNYKLLSNNPLLPDDDACAFQYVFDNQLYIFYSHCLDLTNWYWIIKMVKATR
ncbi:MAG: hypothetical protein ACYDEE_06610 [Ignavibacteriaceae bacterium]